MGERPKRFITLRSGSPEDTRSIARSVTPFMHAGAVVGLIGALGTGKTEWVKGMVEALGGRGESVTSPTYTIINEYETDPVLYHFDLYRLEKKEQLDDIGAEEYFWGEGLCAVEWADLFLESLPDDLLIARFSRLDETTREIRVETTGSGPFDWPLIEKALANLK